QSTMNPLLRDQSRWPESLRAAVRAGLSVAQPTVTADTDRNRLLISAPEELMPLADELVLEFDRAREGDVVADVRLFTLAQANAVDVAKALDAAEQARAQTRPGGTSARIVAEPSSNTVLVTANAERLDAIAEAISQLDSGMSADQSQVRTIFLKHARAEAIAPSVRELLASEEIPIWMKFEAARRRSDIPETGPDVRVAADERLNAILVSAPPAVLNMVEQMIVQLDVDPRDLPGTTARSVQVMSVVNADAAELAATLDELFDEGDAVAPKPVIRVDRSSNSLLIRATADQFATIARIVSDIDDATIGTSRQMQLIPIDPGRANARDLAEALRQMLDRGEGSTVEVITVEELLERQKAPGR
ncbi:MAG: hypothetical protein KC983_12835, partial [Phycisphaerales bacterium]|nr:hypothetical protein [Phycisphaerales bacterium]